MEPQKYKFLKILKVSSNQQTNTLTTKGDVIEANILHNYTIYSYILKNTINHMASAIGHPYLGISLLHALPTVNFMCQSSLCDTASCFHYVVSSSPLWSPNFKIIYLVCTIVHTYFSNRLYKKIIKGCYLDYKYGINDSGWRVFFVLLKEPQFAAKNSYRNTK